MGDLPRLTYLTVDSLSEGVGRSQVLPYVLRLAERGLEVTLHSFEKSDADPSVASRLAAAGVRWQPHVFKGDGAAGGLIRVMHGAALVATQPLVHARSDLAAASCLLTGKRRWIWDMRSLWREERIAAGMLREGAPQERVMRRVEGLAARSSTGIITLSAAAIEILRQRYGDAVASKSTVITTCVDLSRFTATPFPPRDTLQFLLAGTLSPVYDVDSMARLAERMAARRPAHLTVLTPEAGRWGPIFERVGATVAWVDGAAMPDHVRQSHVGLSMRHPDVSNCAATPTKLGEFLATGRPVVVSPGLGDMDDLVARHDCGVVVGDLSDDGLDRSAAELERLVDDSDTPKRCRALAEEYFDLDRGVDALVGAYHSALR